MVPPANKLWWRMKQEQLVKKKEGLLQGHLIMLQVRERID
jgi:hypothetical protein